MTTNIYDFFDDIVCINLDISKDRRKHAEYFFKQLNIPATFFTASKHKNGGMYGCFDSHIQILKNAYYKNLDNILVFEDDFLPTDSYSEENMKKAVDFMKNNEDWDIFHLGYSFIKDTIDGTSTIFSANFLTDSIVQYNPFCTQALCYSRRAIKTILDNYKDYIGIIHYDMYISTHIDLKNYCIVPMLFDQNFYFQHNNESTDIIEYLVRSIFPVLAFTKVNYRMTLFKYKLRNSLSLSRYSFIYICCIMTYILKLYLKFYKIKNICI